MSPPRGTPAQAAFHVVFGTDEFQASIEARKLVDALCPAAEQAFGLETIDASRETVDEIEQALRKCLEALRTVGFFGSRKVVWLRDAFFLGDIQQCSSEGVKARLAELAAEVKAGLIEGHTLVLSTAGFDRRPAFFKACQELAALHAYDLPEKPRDAEASVRAFCAEQLEAAGLRSSGRGVESFVERCGDDRRQIANEVEKLAIYLGGRKDFTPEDVRAIVSPTRELPGWDLQDEFGDRQLPAALSTLRQLFFQKENPIGLLIGLEGRVRDLLLFRDLLQRRWVRVSGSGNWKKVEWSAPPEADEVFGAFEKDPRRMNEWRAGKLAEQASRFSLDELRACHALIADTHEKMVSSPVPPDMLLELFLIRTLGGGDREAVAR